MASVSEYSGSQSAAQRMKDSYDAERAQSSDSHEKEIEKLKEDYETELQSSRKELSEQLASEKASAREEIQKLKEDLYDNTGKKATREAKEASGERRAYSNYRGEVLKEAEQKSARSQEYADDRVKQVTSRTDSKVEDAVNAQKNSSSQQVAGLEAELSVYRNEGRDVDSARAKAKEQVIGSFEKEKVDEQNRIIESYERTLSRMKQHDAETEDRFHKRTAEVVVEANQNAEKQVRLEKDEFKHIERDHGIRENYIQTTLQNQLKSEKFRNELGQNNLIAKSNGDIEKLARSKDESFAGYITEKNKKLDYDLSTRDAKITELSTTDDPLKVSPFLVEKIQKSEEKRFTAEMQEADRVHSNNLQAERDRDRGERSELRDGFQKKFTDNTRDKQRTADIQSKQFMGSYDDLKNAKMSQVAGLNDRAAKNSERMHLQNSLNLTAAEQQKQEALEEQRISLQEGKNVAVDEAAQSFKNKDREWAMKMNDLRRSYDTKLTDERDLHEKNVAELRLEYDKKLRDQGRGSNRVLDDRVRSYEHLIKQQELSFKEKEHSLTEHYEEELGTMKRSNAQLIQKKS